MIIQCQTCSKKLKAPDSAAGKKVKCPGCESVISIKPAQSSTAEPAGRAKKSAPARKKRPSASRGTGAPSRRERPADKRQSPPKRKKRKRSADDLFGDDFGDLSQGEDYDDLENPYAAPRATGGSKKRKGKRGRKSEGLGTVGAGLLVQGWAIVGTILMVAVFVLTAMASGPGGGIGSGVMLLGVGSIVAGLAMLIGEVMCLAAPVDSGAKGLIIATVCCSAVNICASIANSVGGPNLALAAVGGLAGLGRVVLFLLFLRAIANYAGLQERGNRALTVLIGMPTCSLLIVGGGVVLLALRAGGGVVALLFGILVFACMVAMLVFSVITFFYCSGWVETCGDRVDDHGSTDPPQLQNASVAPIHQLRKQLCRQYAHAGSGSGPGTIGKGKGKGKGRSPRKWLPAPFPDSLFSFFSVFGHLAATSTNRGGRCSWGVPQAQEPAGGTVFRESTLQKSLLSLRNRRL